MSLEPQFLPSAVGSQPRPHITVRPEAPSQPDTSQPRFELRKPIQKATLGDNGPAWGGDGFGVEDAIDLVNPLHHVPIVGHIYRALTGDTISNEASIIGGAAFSGAIGLAAAGVTALIAQEAEAKPAAPALAAVKNTEQPPHQSMAQMVRRPLITVPEAQPPAPLEAESALNTPNLAPLPDRLPESALQPIEVEPNYAIPRAAITTPMPPATTPQMNAEIPKTQRPSNNSSANEPISNALPLSMEERHKHDAILELFGSGVSSLHGEYRKTQQLAYLHNSMTQITV